MGSPAGLEQSPIEPRLALGTCIGIRGARDQPLMSPFARAAFPEIATVQWPRGLMSGPECPMEQGVRDIGRKRVGAAAGLSLVLCLALTGCGNGTSESSDPSVATVAGVDADADGIRDDVESYIDQTYADTATRNALRQYAKAAQSAMVDAGNAALSTTHAVERFRAIECIMGQRPNDFPTVFSDLRARILNTTLRTNAYCRWMAK